MKESLVITKFSNAYVKDAKKYLWVFAEDDDDDISINHPPVLDWQSGLENLKQLHTEPVEQKEISDDDDEDANEKCECVITTIEIDNESEFIIDKIQKIFKKLEIDDASNFLKRFSETKEPIYLYKAIKETKDSDPVSCYQLGKIAKKIKINKGQVKISQ